MNLLQKKKKKLSSALKLALKWSTMQKSRRGECVCYNRDFLRRNIKDIAAANHSTVCVERFFSQIWSTGQATENATEIFMPLWHMPVWHVPLWYVYRFSVASVSVEYISRRFSFARHRKRAAAIAEQRYLYITLSGEEHYRTIAMSFFFLTRVNGRLVLIWITRTGWFCAPETTFNIIIRIFRVNVRFAFNLINVQSFRTGIPAKQWRIRCF